MVDGKTIGSCLGDEFSVRWMEDSESTDSSNETIAQQFNKLKSAVTKSHVMQYGVTSFDSEPIGDFQGIHGQSLATDDIAQAMPGLGVDSRQVEVHQAYYKVVRAATPAARKDAEAELAGILARRHSADEMFGNIASIAMNGNAAKAQEMLEGPTSSLENVDCHARALQSVVRVCGAFNDYSLRYSRLFVNLCNNGVSEAVITSAIETGCGPAVIV